jgi:hypothetical protein
MSQDKTLTTATLPPQDVTAVDSATLVSTYADTLMTGLFDDIERLLEGNESALAAVEAESAAVETTPEDLAIDPEADSVAADEAALTTTLPSNELDFFDSEAATPPPSTPATKTRLGKLLDRLLLASTALSLMGVVGFLWVSQRHLTPETGLGSVPSASVNGGQTNAEFLNYLQRSLDVITQKVEQGAIGNQVAGGQGVDLSLVPVNPPLLPSGNAGVMGGQRINVIERVYIPYQTSQPLQPAPAQPGVVMPMPVAPPTAIAPSPGAPPATPGVSHLLVGVLELGDRSAALFEINGVAQRVYIGERIGNAGWSLVSVSSQEVVIRRNGEVRSLYIGQQF